jgi:hypothetical protein
LINGTLHKRPEVASIIRGHVEKLLGKKSSFDFPLNCPTLSLSLEKELIPHFSSFWEQVEKKKFSWIDTESALNDTTWLEYFGDKFK